MDNLEIFTEMKELYERRTELVQKRKSSFKEMERLAERYCYQSLEQLIASGKIIETRNGLYRLNHYADDGGTRKRYIGQKIDKDKESETYGKMISVWKDTEYVDEVFVNASRMLESDEYKQLERDYIQMGQEIEKIKERIERDFSNFLDAMIQYEMGKDKK